MDAVVARKTWRTLEPLHGIVYFAPERDAVYDTLGLRREQSYFVARAAAMGAVPADVVIATFFNFHPDFVRGAMVDAWEITTPRDALAARLEVVDRVLSRLLGDAVRSPEMIEAAGLARAAAERATTRPEGRPLFAGHADLEWPSDTAPHLVFWHAQTLLREFRGDAHVAALMLDGLTGCEALVTHAGTGEIAASALRASRQWSRSEWDASAQHLRERGVIDDEGRLTETGRRRRDDVEDTTDRASVYAYEGLGDDGCERLRALVRPMAKAIAGSGELGFRRPD